MEFLLLMMLVEIDMVLSILLSISFSNGLTSQRNGVGDICGFVSQNTRRSSFINKSSNRNIHQGFGISPHNRFVSGRVPLFAIISVSGNMKFHAFFSLWLNQHINELDLLESL